MEIVQTWISPRASERTAAGGDLVTEYVERSGRYCPCSRHTFGDEAAFWAWLGAGAGKERRGKTFVALLDGAGQQMSSEVFAERVGRLRDDGVRRMVLGVGPADGWLDDSRRRADLVLSLGRMTLPHELARVVLAEQVYRALTILAGHPYHTGH